MKNLNLRSWMLFIAFTFIFLGNVAATNYVVSGAAYQDCNGLYVETGTWNDKPLYIFNSDNTFAIGWSEQDGMWLMGIWMDGIVMTFYWNDSFSDQCPTVGWDGYQNPAPTVTIERKSLSYSSALFTENDINDGSIANTIVITYNEFGEDALTGSMDENFITSNKVTVSNVPSGLTASIIKTASNQLTFSLTGNATNHTMQDNINNITVTFNDDAFDQGNASGVTNYNKSDIEIHFNLFSGGNGTIDNPFLISNKTDLRYLSETNDPENLWRKHFIQTADISFDASDFESGGDFYNSGEGWIPIGNTDASFEGTYNGQNHTISGLYINRPVDNQGLFGAIYEKNSKIENLGVIDVDINANNFVGGLIGIALSFTINNCYSSGNVTGTINVGGLVGYNLNNSGLKSNSYSNTNLNLVGGTSNESGGKEEAGTTSNCYSTGNVSGLNNVGGLVGVNSGNISNSYCTGNVTREYETEEQIGGFVGFNSYGIITNSYSTGSVTYTGYANPTNKGFAGEVTDGTISNCFWDIETSGQTTSSGTATGKTTAEMKTEVTFTSWDFTATTGIWEIESGSSISYPYLQGNTQNPAPGHETLGYTWDGSSSSDWNTAANWNMNAVPNAGDNVTIANVTNDPVIASGVGASCNNLTVNSGVSLTVKSGGSLITNGTITNNGTISIEKTITNDIWHYISSPVENATSNVFFGNYLQNWSEPTALWSDITETNVALTPGKGFGLWGETKTSNTYTFTGLPNTGNVPIGITFTEVPDFSRDGANLLGNPYPSSIDWELVNDDYGAVYYWDGAAYVAYPAGEPMPGGGTYGTGSQYVPPMQGFFIIVPDGNPNSFTFTNAMRTHSGATSYYKSEKTLPDGIMLYADNGSYQDKLLIRLNDEAAENMELNRDAWKFPTITQGLSQLWSVCPDGNLSIDVRPETETIQLGFANNQNGTYSIGINEIANISSADPEHTKLNHFHNLSNGAYSFDWNPADSEERFILHLKATGTNDLEAQAPQVYAAGNRVYVHLSELNSYSEMAVYDLRGRVIVKKILTATSLQSFELNQPSGVYLVQLIGTENSKSYKIVL